MHHEVLYLDRAERLDGFGHQPEQGGHVTLAVAHGIGLTEVLDTPRLIGHA